jgi:DNA-binding IclR family transcriptional regulator
LLISAILLHEARPTRTIDHAKYTKIRTDPAPGLVSIACPVRGENQEVVAAINLAAHTSMIAPEDMVNQFLPHLLVTADNISIRLGYRRENPRRA